MFFTKLDQILSQALYKSFPGKSLNFDKTHTQPLSLLCLDSSTYIETLIPTRYIHNICTSKYVHRYYYTTPCWMLTWTTRKVRSAPYENIGCIHQLIYLFSGCRYSWKYYLDINFWSTNENTNISIWTNQDTVTWALIISVLTFLGSVPSFGPK